MALISFFEYARRRGVDPSYITRLYKMGALDGALVVKAGRKKPLVDALVADALLDKVVGAMGKAAPAPDPAGGMASAEGAGEYKPAGKAPSGADSFILARTWSERYKAAERKLSLEIRMGKYVLKSEVYDTNFRAARVFRDGLLNSVARLSPILAAQADAVKIAELLTREFTALLEDIKKALNAPDASASPSG